MLVKLKSTSTAIFASLTFDDWHILSSCNVLLVCHDNDRGYIYKNKAYAQILDSLGDLLENKGLHIQTIAIPFSRLHKSKAYRYPLIFNQSELLLILKTLVIKLICGKQKSTHWYHKESQNFWEKIIKKSQPQVIISIQPDKCLCRAAHMKKIPIYDLQHGIINDQNFWYGQEFNQHKDPEDLPSKFLCWDQEISAATLEKWIYPKGIFVSVIGNPWFQRFIKQKPDDSLVQEALTVKPLLGTDRPNILVSLQWGMTQFFGKYVFNGVMPEALEQTILETAKFYNWLIRLHPVQIKSCELPVVHKYLKNTFGHLKTVEWNQCSQVPLPIVLKWSDLHITYNSTTTTEAAWMGIYTGLLDPEIRQNGEASEYFFYERHLKIAITLPLNSFKIKEWIKQTLIKEKPRSTLIETCSSLDNFIEEISNLCHH